MSARGDDTVENIQIERMVISGVERLVTEPKLRSQFMEGDAQRSTIMQALGLPEELQDDLLQLLIRMAHSRSTSATGSSATGRTSAASGKTSDYWSQSEIADWHATLMKPFRRIEHAYRLSTIMSVSLFVVGLTLFAIAAGRVVLSGSADTGSLLIAGMGVADFIALVYTRPLKDVANTLSQTQRAGVLATSYLAGIPLIREDPVALKNLENLTRLALGGTVVESDQ